MNTDPTATPIGTVWLAVVCETGEEHLYPTPKPVLKVGPNEWHGIETECPDYGWFRAEDYMVNHRATLVPETEEA